MRGRRLRRSSAVRHASPTCPASTARAASNRNKPEVVTSPAQPQPQARNIRNLYTQCVPAPKIPANASATHDRLPAQRDDVTSAQKHASCSALDVDTEGYLQMAAAGGAPPLPPKRYSIQEMQLKHHGLDTLVPIPKPRKKKLSLDPTALSSASPSSAAFAQQVPVMTSSCVGGISNERVVTQDVATANSSQEQDASQTSCEANTDITTANESATNTDYLNITSHAHVAPEPTVPTPDTTSSQTPAADTDAAVTSECQVSDHATVVVDSSEMSPETAESSSNENINATAAYDESSQPHTSPLTGVAPEVNLAQTAQVVTSPDVGDTSQPEVVSPGSSTVEEDEQSTNEVERVQPQEDVAADEDEELEELENVDDVTVDDDAIDVEVDDDEDDAITPTNDVINAETVFGRSILYSATDVTLPAVEHPVLSRSPSERFDNDISRVSRASVTLNAEAEVAREPDASDVTDVSLSAQLARLQCIESTISDQNAQRVDDDGEVTPTEARSDVTSAGDDVIDGLFGSRSRSRQRSRSSPDVELADVIGGRRAPISAADLQGNRRSMQLTSPPTLEPVVESPLSTPTNTTSAATDEPQASASGAEGGQTASEETGAFVRQPGNLVRTSLRRSNAFKRRSQAPDLEPGARSRSLDSPMPLTSDAQAQPTETVSTSAAEVAARPRSAEGSSQTVTSQTGHRQRLQGECCTFTRTRVLMSRVH